jgi:hypothetical protein
VLRSIRAGVVAIKEGAVACRGCQATENRLETRRATFALESSQI